MNEIFWFLVCCVLAALEIEIEGKNGWAKKLPTWRKERGVYSYIMEGKPLTGYHLFLFLLVLLLVHTPFFGLFRCSWTIQKELVVMSLCFLMYVTWDFLWFVLNPHYTVRRFKKENIDFHAHWLGRIPVDYVKGISASFILCAFTYFTYQPLGFQLLKIYLVFSIGKIITIIFAPMYHKWYWRMRPKNPTLI